MRPNKEQTIPDQLLINRELFSSEVINERYIQSLRSCLTKYNFTFRQDENRNDSHNDDSIIQIQQSQQARSIQSQFYYQLLKRFYQVRKVLKHQFTFQAFLSQYNDQINKKIENYGIDQLFTEIKSSNQLNLLTLQNQLTMLKSEAKEKLKTKQKDIQKLQQQSVTLNQEYNDLISELVERNTSLSVENIELQLKLKLHQARKKDNLTKVYRTEKKTTERVSKISAVSSNSYKGSNSSLKNEQKQQLERIKTVIKNNMWGWGEQIINRLNRLKTLKAQLDTNKNPL